MRRGDLVPVVLAGAYGKPRPALVIQSDLFALHPSLTVLPVTSELRPIETFRILVEPSEEFTVAQFQRDPRIEWFESAALAAERVRAVLNSPDGFVRD